MGFLHKRTISISLSFLCFAYPAHAELQLAIHPDHYAVAIDDQQQEQETISAIPGNTLLVDDSNWNNQRAATVKDVTDYMPGVFAQPHDGDESFRLSIRGSGLANTFQGRGLLVMQDGIPITMADGEFEFPVIDPWLITYAEVFPGANGMTYGASNFGGAINFITPTGITGNGYELRAEAGSFGTYHGQASAGQIWSNGDIFASAGGFAQSGFRQHNDQDTSRFNGNLGWQISDHFTNRIYISHTHADAEIPGAITRAQSESDPRLANPTNLANDYQRDLDITRIADKSAWEDGPERVDSAIFYTYRTLDNPVTTYEFQHNNDVGIREKYTHRFGLSQWLAGFNSYYGTTGESRFQNLNATPGATILTRNLTASTSEAYGQLEQHLTGKLFGIVGAQQSYATRDIDQLTPALATQNKTYSGFSPRIGLRYDFTKDTQAFANLSRSFEPPTFSELSGGNTPGFFNLKAQTATTAEIGARGLARGVHWQAAYYHGWLRNEFVNYLFPDNSTATINVARTKRDGIELGMDGDIAKDIWTKQDAVTLRVAYTFSHFTLDHDPFYGNNTLPGVPKHYLRAETLYRHFSGISLGPNVEWAPKASPVDLTNTLYTGSYAIFGLRGFWESPDRRLNVYIEGRNLLDKNYIATNNVVPNASGVDGRYFYPGEGRAIYAGIRWKL
jgi:iron complex outermembrane receptor protein